MQILSYSTTQKCTAIDARESAPKSATVEYFTKHKGRFKIRTGQTALIGWKNLPALPDWFSGWDSIAVPGEIKGYWYAYKKFGSGKIAWKDLFDSAIDLAENGLYASATFEKYLKTPFLHDAVMNESSMR